MTLNDVLQYYKNPFRMQKQTGLYRSNFYNWKKIGYVPLAAQMKLERFTNGALKANIDDCPR